MNGIELHEIIHVEVKNDIKKGVLSNPATDEDSRSKEQDESSLHSETSTRDHERRDL